MSSINCCLLCLSTLPLPACMHAWSDLTGERRNTACWAATTPFPLPRRVLTRAARLGAITTAARPNSRRRLGRSREIMSFLYRAGPSRGRCLFCPPAKKVRTTTCPPRACPDAVGRPTTRPARLSSLSHSLPPRAQWLFTIRRQALPSPGWLAGWLADPTRPCWPQNEAHSSRARLLRLCLFLFTVFLISLKRSFHPSRLSRPMLWWLLLLLWGWVPRNLKQAPNCGIAVFGFGWLAVCVTSLPGQALSPTRHLA